MLSLNPYLNGMTEAGHRPALYMNGRPVWGPHNYDLETYGEMRVAFLTSLESMQTHGGALIIQFTPQMERSAIIFFNIVMGGLIRQGTKVRFTQFLDAPMLVMPEDASVWLIHHAGLFPDLMMALENWIRPGRVTILSGTTSTLAPLAFNIPSLLFPGFAPPDQGFDRKEKEAVMMDHKILASKDHALGRENLLTKIHRQVALFDAWASPIPLGLLARCLKMDEDDLAPLVEELYQEGEEGILYWVEREKPPMLMVSTRSEGYAHRCLASLVEGQGLSLDDYRPLVQAIQPDKMGERYALLHLLLGMLANSRSRWRLGAELFGVDKMRELVLADWHPIRTIALAGSPAEHLLWGLCLTRLGLLDQGRNILECGMRKDKKNVFIQQALAHLLSLWSRLDENKGEDAARAFDRATELTKGNKHIWQAWGVFEAERGNWRGAEYCFQKALSIDPRNIFSLVARANMYLDRGDPEKAKVDLSKAFDIDPANLYAIHMNGRIALYSGEWKAAAQSWQRILKTDKHNIYTLQSLAYMARVRGCWDIGRQYLEKAIDIDPENVAILLEIGLLDQDMRFFVSSQDAKDQHLRGALAYFYRALSVAPWNPKVIVSLAIAERQSGKVQEAKERLETLIKRLPNNDHARHALAVCENDLGDRDGMIRRLQSIHDERRGRNLPVLFLLIEAMIVKGQTEEAKRSLRDIERNRLQGMSAVKKINALLETAHLYLLLDEKQRARSVLHVAERLDPDNMRIKWFKERN
ncbi:MAG: tetratricopeptide repeat protein [Syntrophus sp. (in: bacteria)]